MSYFVYIMSNAARTVLYVGVTNGLTKRVLQHREERDDGFTARYHLNRLVYVETYEKPSDAIRREKQLKGWRREKKDTLILTRNPTRDDLAVTMLGLPPAPHHEWQHRGNR
jgi:putative endonuclease